MLRVSGPAPPAGWASRSEVPRDERGVALSSPIALLSAAAVVVAGAAFLTTGHSDHERAREAAQPVRAIGSPVVSPVVSPVARPSRSAPAAVIRKKKPKKPVVRRQGVYVEVYNNSGISGLAGATAARATASGWEVLGSDNWYGTIAASTVYYPARLQAQAKLLARDLGIARLRPAIAPMRFDRLTVILTSDYA